MCCLCCAVFPSRQCVHHVDAVCVCLCVCLRVCMRVPVCVCVCLSAQPIKTVLVMQKKQRGGTIKMEMREVDR